MPDLPNSLQLQISSLLLEDDGELTQRMQAGRTLRAAILLDLVASGGLRNDADSIDIVPTDDLLTLAAWLVGPDRAVLTRDAQRTPEAFHVEYAQPGVRQAEAVLAGTRPEEVAELVADGADSACAR